MSSHAALKPICTPHDPLLAPFCDVELDIINVRCVQPSAASSEAALVLLSAGRDQVRARDSRDAR